MRIKKPVQVQNEDEDEDKDEEHEEGGMCYGGSRKIIRAELAQAI